jgi:leader peptidase (prepilin peptidase)/N-methyltransferase
MTRRASARLLRCLKALARKRPIDSRPNEKSTCECPLQLILVLGEQRHHHALGVGGLQQLHALEGHQHAVAASSGGSADGDVEVGGTGGHGGLEQGDQHRIWIEHGASLRCLRSSNESGPCVMTIAISALYGLLIGSFLTVVVDRVPSGASIVQPGSACGNCGLRLGPRDLVPVFSWLALRGKCRKCHTNIGTEPLVLELSTSLLFGLTAWHFGLSWRTPAFCVLMGGLVALSWIDLRTRGGCHERSSTAPPPSGLPLLVVAALVERTPERLWMMLLGAAIAVGTDGLIYWASRGGMGDGDVRLAPLLGMYLGWLNPGLAPVGLFFGFACGAVVGVAVVVARRGDRKTALPFGPFLALGTVLAMFFGQRYIDFLLVR